MTHSAPFSHIAYQLPDGTTGVLNNHDADALHDAAGSVDDENLATGAVTNGKIAAGVVTDAELAANAVTEAKIADGAVTSDKLSEDVWDSISQRTKIAYEDVTVTINPVTSINTSTGQPQTTVLPVQHTTADNYLGRELIRAWPRSTWTTTSGQQPIVMMQSQFTNPGDFNRVVFLSNHSQIYEITVRFWYRMSE